MVVAVIAVWMVKASVYEVVNMVAVGNRFVAAPRSVNVSLFVSATNMVLRADIRVGLGDFDLVLLDLSVLTHVMEVSVVEVVHMVAMLNPSVSAVGAMLVIMVFVKV